MKSYGRLKYYTAIGAALLLASAPVLFDLTVFAQDKPANDPADRGDKAIAVEQQDKPEKEEPREQEKGPSEKQDITSEADKKPDLEKRAEEKSEQKLPSNDLDYLVAYEKYGDYSGAAKAVLEKHCASCHQDGKTTGKYKDRAAGNFGYVLEFEQMKARGLVKAGLPDASPIFIKTDSGEMPKGISDDCYDVSPAKDAYCGLDVKEKIVLKKWIENMKDDPKQAERKFISDKEILNAMAKDISSLSEAVRPHIRYFTLTNLYNSGDSDENMAGYGQALLKLVNSLSFESDPVTLVPVDEYKTIWRINIKEAGWSHDKWDYITKLDPYAVYYDDPNFGLLQNETKAQLPFLRGDWFTYSASQPPLYEYVLGLPDNKHDLEKMLGLNVLKNIDNLKAARAGFQRSGVSENNRLIERHSSRTGAYWESYDFGGNADRQSFFKFPFGPHGALGELSKKYGFVHDGGEVIFELPNGFHGYYLTDHKGKRIERGPQTIVTHNLRRDRAVTNGISCMDCHNKGIKFNDHRPRDKQDQVRDYAKSTAELPKKTHEIIDALYPKHEDFYKLMLGDAERYEQSLKTAGVNMNTTVDRMEMVNGLFMRFERNLTMEAAAAEIGMAVEDFEEEANKIGGDVYAIKQRLLNDMVPRDQFIKEFAYLVEKMTTNKPVSYSDYQKAVAKKDVQYDHKSEAKAEKVTSTYVAEVKPVDPKYSKTFDLAFFPNESKFVKGQPVSFTVRSTQSCYLTILNIPEKGPMTVIFPNKFNADNKISANVSYELPGKLIDGFTFRFNDAGYEKVVAFCNASRPDPAGIVHNFGKNAYTILENDYERFGQSTRAHQKARQIIVEHKSGKSSGHETEREKKMPSLIDNPYNSHIDIEARKAVLLNVQDY